MKVPSGIFDSSGRKSSGGESLGETELAEVLILLCCSVLQSSVSCMKRNKSSVQGADVSHNVCFPPLSCADGIEGTSGFYG